MDCTRVQEKNILKDGRATINQRKGASNQARAILKNMFFIVTLLTHPIFGLYSILLFM
jgi:hypothetical protein